LTFELLADRDSTDEDLLSHRQCSLFIRPKSDTPKSTLLSTMKDPTMLMIRRSTKRNKVQTLADKLRRGKMEVEQQIEEPVRHCLLANKSDL
jgi:hypothetical protein